jgi:hypothetical protein
MFSWRGFGTAIAPRTASCSAATRERRAGTPIRSSAASPTPRTPSARSSPACSRPSTAATAPPGRFRRTSSPACHECGRIGTRNSRALTLFGGRSHAATHGGNHAVHVAEAPSYGPRRPPGVPGSVGRAASTGRSAQCWPPAPLYSALLGSPPWRRSAWLRSRRPCRPLAVIAATVDFRVEWEATGPAVTRPDRRSPPRIQPRGSVRSPRRCRRRRSPGAEIASNSSPAMRARVRRVTPRSATNATACS